MATPPNAPHTQKRQSDKRRAQEIQNTPPIFRKVWKCGSKARPATAITVDERYGHKAVISRARAAHNVPPNVERYINIYQSLNVMGGGDVVQGRLKVPSVYDEASGVM
jgi:hypothetical protein